jgi:hypothetical protein
MAQHLEAVMIYILPNNQTSTIIVRQILALAIRMRPTTLMVNPLHGKDFQVVLLIILVLNNGKCTWCYELRKW